MPFDSNTVVALLAFVALLSGGLLLIIGYLSNATATTALWAAANLSVAAAAIFLLQNISVEIAFLCITLMGGLMWTAIAKFNRRPVPTYWFAGGLVVWAIISFVPPMRFGYEAVAYLTMPTIYVAHTCLELWQHTDRLPARLPLLGLMLIDLGATAAAAVAMIPMTELPAEAAGGTLLPVYFAMMVFIVGSAVFVIALVKERAVAEQTSAANTDGLTGLANRGALLAAGASTLSRTLQHGNPIAIALFDLDRFKSINDRFGHQTGDIVLQRFAEAVLSVLRPSDLIGRIGGEEFLAIIPSANEEAAIAIADRIRRTFAATAEWIDGKPVKATLSAGVAVSGPTDQAVVLEDLIGRADQALYAAKRAGRNRIATDAEPELTAATNIVRIA